jgi:hypothetical protein
VDGVGEKVRAWLDDRGLLSAMLAEATAANGCTHRHVSPGRIFCFHPHLLKFHSDTFQILKYLNLKNSYVFLESAEYSLVHPKMRPLVRPPDGAVVAWALAALLIRLEDPDTRKGILRWKLSMP